MSLNVSQEDLFQTPGLQEELQNIIDCLDTSIPDSICILVYEACPPDTWHIKSISTWTLLCFGQKIISTMALWQQQETNQTEMGSKKMIMQNQPEWHLFSVLTST